MKNTFWTRVSRSGRARANAQRNRDRRRRSWRCHVDLEGLEDRIVLSQVDWINPAGGDWDTPANWSTGAVPTASEDAVIDVAGSVTITHSLNTTDIVHSV